MASSDGEGSSVGPLFRAHRIPHTQGSENFMEKIEIGELIGEGTFGKVYIALNTQDQKQYAIKKMAIDLLYTREYELIQDEVFGMLRVSHPKLLKQEYSLVWEQFIVVVMPLMVFSSCDQIMRRAYPHGLPEPVIGLIIKDIMNAVVYMHSRRIVHRTIKASHILIHESGAAVLTGFRYMTSIPYNMETLHVQNMMTVMGQYINWLSPEMLSQDSRGFGLNVDMYSIGITICELANGKVPYADVSPSGILVKKLEEPAPQLWDKDFLPSHETRGATTDAPRGILRNPMDQPYRQKTFSQQIKKFVAMCLVANPELRICGDEAIKHKFCTTYSREGPGALLRNLPLIGDPLQYKPIAGAAIQALTSQATQHSQEPIDWNFTEYPS